MTRRSRRGSARRALLPGALALALAVPSVARAFGLADVEARARALAAQPYRAPPARLPEGLAHLSYDQYRDIRYRPDRALWRDAGLPFEVMFFPVGWSATAPVGIHEVDGDQVRDVPFDPAAFDWGKNAVDPARLGGAGFAGFRVHFPVNRPDYRDETLVFLGASYFRALGRGQRYGASARGLAVDTAASTGEEFPRFVEFWLERPGKKARDLTLLALLDSPRIAGAYRFVLRPGVTTVMEVEAVLFPRDRIGKLGIAPLTSMFFFGADQRAAAEDYRPEVHDSDGLLVHAGSGEWIWRPAVSPKRLLVTSFALEDPAGFGLMQRERRFERYEDLEARYDLRPSVWIEPVGRWGKGRVELVELPLPDETNDNLVAYWVPDRAPGPQERVDFRYRVEWQRDRPTRPPLGWVAQTRRGRGFARGADDTVELHVDFDGPALARLPADAKVEGVVTADGNGQLVETHTTRNDPGRGWRVTLRVRRRDGGKPVELRAYLRDPTDVLSETWSFILPPE
jgi:glucans biosynthesis protein